MNVIYKYIYIYLFIKYVQLLISTKALLFFSPLRTNESIFLVLLVKHFAFCSGFQIASAKAAQHRLERGVWTSVRFGDMRRALAGLK